jgi:hypothetical protein
MWSVLLLLLLLLLLCSCPGGGRVWPVPDYWSATEYLAPSVCPVVQPRTCSGTPIIGGVATVDSSQASAAASTAAADGEDTSGAAQVSAKDTQRCEAGYTGEAHSNTRAETAATSRSCN